MDGGVDAVDILLADKPGDDDVRSQRYADKQAQHHADDRAVAADGRHGLLADKLAEHGDVGGVEQLLHNACKGEGQGHDEDFIPQRAFEHVDASRIVLSIHIAAHLTLRTKQSPPQHSPYARRCLTNH